ncbi:MAG: hypothetical protein ACI3XA_10330 [Clostridia bacterium]
MSSICPKCGKFMENGFCEKCQADESDDKMQEKNIKKEETITVNAEVTEQEESSYELDYSRNVKPLKKKILPIIAVISVAFVILMILIPNPEAKLYKEIVNEYQYPVKKEHDDYRNTLEDIEEFSETYSNKKRYIKKINALKEDVEEDLYTELLNCNDDEYEINRFYDVYMDYYPNGKYVDDFVEAQREMAIKNLNSAKKFIEDGGYIFADECLKDIEKNVNADEKTKSEAKKLAKSIESKVAIIGTWKKATGVQYTFEGDGHMSVSMPSYNAYNGTFRDSLEVKDLLDEIDDFGRIVRGGTWEYIDEIDGIYAYSLYYNGSYFYMYEDEGILGIKLQSGLGEMSYLFR